MAAGVVSLVLNKLTTSLMEEVALVGGARDQVEWLKDEMGWMESCLEDADAKRRKGNAVAQNWVKMVSKVAHRAECIIDTFVLEIEARRRQMRSRGAIMRFIKKSTDSPSKLKCLHNVGEDIKLLKTTIGEITASRDRYGRLNLENDPGESAPAESLQARKRISDDLDDIPVGLDSHKEIILRLLDHNNSNKRRSVISLVGIGGIGKTTLTKMVYDSSEIKGKFDSLACVSVSQDFDAGEIIKSIAKQVMRTPMRELEAMHADDLKDTLRGFLEGKRYLVVLDDVWSRNVWEKARDVLPDMSNGSRVLITTRSLEVARSAAAAAADPTIPPYQLPFLDKDKSWELFLRKAFRGNQDSSRGGRPISCPEGLEDAGHQLIKRCGGLPLALVVLGGLVSNKDRSPAAWSQVVKSIDWAWAHQDGGECLKILALSYHDLPDRYRRSCFLHLGSFPEDSVIDAAQLTQLWIAEGFIPQSARSLMESTAEGYLEELAQRSMIQIVDKDFDGSILTCRIHDLFRDFCLNEALQDGFLNVYSPSYSFRPDDTTRRLALHNLTPEYVRRSFYPPSNLRSLSFFRTQSSNTEIFCGLKFLRVIYFKDTSRCGFERLPEEITGMIHLRYLRLAGCEDLKELPESIGNLRYLQTLDIAHTSITSLPKTLGKIQTLRHLYLPQNCECPPNLGNLINLWTLMYANARGGWIEGGLEKLFNIRDLRVTGLKDTLQGKGFRESLLKLDYLSSLELRYAGSISEKFITCLSNHKDLRRLYLDGSISQGQLPSSTSFPQILTELTLRRSQLKQDPMATLEKLPSLMFLELDQDSFVEKEMVCTAGGFKQLRTLSLDRLGGLEHWTVEATAMPDLTSLRIRNCSRLVMLPDGLRHVRSLKSLDVFDTREEFRRRLQKDSGLDWNKIKHVTSVVAKDPRDSNDRPRFQTISSSRLLDQ